MVMNAKAFHGLPVRTRSGMHVGKVGSMDIETDTGRIAFLGVKTGSLVAAFLGQELDVAWRQIISVDDKEVVVEDAVVPAEGHKARVNRAASIPAGAHVSEAIPQTKGAAEAI